ncbi:hypothetical protein Dimus_022079 [Dionaea muscipula]
MKNMSPSRHVVRPRPWRSWIETNAARHRFHIELPMGRRRDGSNFGLLHAAAAVERCCYSLTLEVAWSASVMGRNWSSHDAKLKWASICCCGCWLHGAWAERCKLLLHAAALLRFIIGCVGWLISMGCICVGRIQIYQALEITRRFANDDTIMKARRVKSIEMKPSPRFIHFLVMKNVIPRFGKRDTTSFMDLSYMDHLTAKRLVNLPRVMMRHMSYVISVKDHELPYGDWLTMVFDAFGVPLVDKKGEEPKRYDYFEETFLTMCKLTRENGIWWIGSGENRRRDDDVNAPEEEAEEEEERNKDDFDWEAVIDEATVEGESGSDDQFYDAQVEVEEPVTETPRRLSESQLHLRLQQKDKEPSGVDPSCPTGRLPEAEFLKFQAEFERKRANRFHDDLEKAKAENARLLALLHQAQTKPHP